MTFLPESADRPGAWSRPLSPELMIGAASPLWGYFGGAAAAGVAWWWMTRWTPQNLEAMFAAASLRTLEAAEDLVAAEVGAPLQAAAELTCEVTPTAIEAAEALPPMGGESAPIGPVAAELMREETAAPPVEPAPPPKAKRAAPDADPASA